MIFGASATEVPDLTPEGDATSKAAPNENEIWSGYNAAGDHIRVKFVNKKSERWIHVGGLRRRVPRIHVANANAVRTVPFFQNENWQSNVDVFA
jgi:hypothetical protein